MERDIMSYSSPLLATVVVMSLGWVSPQSRSDAVPPDLPKAFQQLVPRGAFPSVDAPEFVSADEAKIPGDAWVLGVAIDGQARAYSLNLLNQHEIVNDRINDKSFAAVW